MSEVRNERLFGCVEGDIRVPEHLKEKFSEMCPIFKNTKISRNDIGDFMKAYAEEHGIMAEPRHSLIGSMKGEKILLATPPLKWYREHGLEVTKVHQVVEFIPEPCFEPFGDAVSDARRTGDADPSKAIIADTMKLVSSYAFLGKYTKWSNSSLSPVSNRLVTLFQTRGEPATLIPVKSSLQIR